MPLDALDAFWGRRVCSSKMIKHQVTGVPKKRPERPGASRASTVVKRWSLFCRHEWWHVDAFWLNPKSIHCTSETKKRPQYFKTKKHPLYSKTKPTVSIFSYGSVNSKAVELLLLLYSIVLEMATFTNCFSKCEVASTKQFQ